MPAVRQRLPVGDADMIKIKAPRVTIADRIRELELQHGGLRPAARVLGCSAPYLLRLRDGVKEHPSDAFLRKLGLRREIVYTRHCEKENTRG